MRNPERGKASTKQSFVTFFKSMFGAGVLALPNWLAGVGLPLGILVYFLVSLICGYTCKLLVEARNIAIELHQQNYGSESNEETMMSLGSSIENSNADNFSSQSKVPLLNNDIECVEIDALRRCNDENKASSEDSRQTLITYADITRFLLNETASKAIKFTIIILHICFATGLIICIFDTVEDLVDWNRYAVGYGILFPLLIILSQIPFLPDMWQLSALALAIYVVGVIGCSLYSALSEEGKRPAPDDMWHFKWDGILKFTGSATYTLEGVGLVLPTAHSMSDPEHAASVVHSGVLLYGFITISYASLVYAGGGGGLEIDDDCDIVANCIGPHALKTTVQILIILALTMTYPVFLFPATEMLEVEFADWESSQNDFPCSSSETDDNIHLMPSRDNEKSTTNIARELPTDFGIDTGAEMRIVQKRPKLRIVLVFITVFIGSLVNSFDAYSAFIGSIFLVFAGFLLPISLYRKAMKMSHQYIGKLRTFILAATIIFGLSLMFVGGVTSFIDLIEG